MHPVLFVALILFLTFFVYFFVHSLFLLYHLLRFSVTPATGKTLAVLYILVSVVLLIVALGVLSQISWNASNALPTRGLFTP